MNTTVPWSTFLDYADFYGEVLAGVQAAKEAGKSATEASVAISRGQFEGFEVHPYNVGTIIQAVYDGR